MSSTTPDNTLPRESRLRTGRAFHRIRRRGEVFPGTQCIVRRTPNGHGGARLGLAAPRRYGNAVRRNRFRRLVREAFRLERARLGAYDYLVSPRRNLGEPTLDGIRRDLVSTLTRRPSAPRSRRAQ